MNAPGAFGYPLTTWGARVKFEPVEWFYAMAGCYNGDPAEKRHLGVFAALVCAPDQRVNQVPYFFDAGLVAYGFLRNRPRDFAGFGVAYGSYSGDLRRAEEVQALTDLAVGVQRWEMTLEGMYWWTVKPGLLVQPCIQYLVNPGGDTAVPNALAIGLNIVSNF